MKKQKYTELKALKRKIDETRLTYRGVVARTGISLTALNDKINGYSQFNTMEIIKVAEVLGIDAGHIVLYFFPEMLHGATKRR